MKLLTFFLVFVVVFMAYASAQCPNNPGRHNCNEPRNDGRGGRGCGRGERWYYNTRSRSCDRFHYRGCGGNGNRYCSKADCERQCRH